jgi:S-adenosylmethionine hydrolase
MKAPRTIVTLTTDFGLRDPYVAQMKAVILSIAPEAEIVDLTHEIAPQSPAEAAFVLETSWRYFPSRTIHVVVVDPGVGTGRRRLLLGCQGQFLVGPDNGCLSCALEDDLRGIRAPDGGYEPRALQPGAGVAALSIDSLELLSRPGGATFEGRDVFAPAAALLAAGSRPDELGASAPALLAFPAFRAPQAGQEIYGMVLRSDRFGNLITDIRGEDLPPDARVSIGDEELTLVRTYAESQGLAALVGSSGFVEVALSNGNAAAALAAGPGTRVMVRAAL